MTTKITTAMFMALVINLGFAKGIGLTQGIMARESENDIWIATILSVLQGAVMMLITVWVIRRRPDMTILEQFDAIVGKWVGKVMALLAFVFFLGAYIAILITFVYHFMDYFLPEFPVWVFVLAAVAIPVYAVFHGLEVTARIAVLGVFSIVALNLLIMVGSLKDLELDRLLPVFETGFWNTVATTRHYDTDWAMATMTAGMILPLVNDTKSWAKGAVGGVLYGGILVLLWPILECGVLSAPQTGHYIVACMQMARSAQVGLFLHRYEMIMIAFFGISLLVQLMLLIFCASLAGSHVMGMKDYRGVVIPVSLILGGSGYFVVLNHNRAMSLLTNNWPVIALPIAIGLPLLGWLLGLMFKKKLAAAA